MDHLLPISKIYNPMAATGRYLLLARRETSVPLSAAKQKFYENLLISFDRPEVVLHNWPGSLEVFQFAQDLISNFMHASQAIGDTVICS